MTTNRKAEIICVGTELLLGQIVNTNAAWLARELSLLGIHSYYQTVVGDNPGRLADCIRQAIGRSDIILLTGGLGPTQDDITMAVASSVTGLPLKLHEPSRAAIADYFQRMGRFQVTSNNWKQAMLPDPGIVMPNSNGTAPGAILETRQGDRTVHLVLLPGPPSEMTVMFREQAAPWLQAQTTARLRHVFVRMIGIGESAAEAALSDLIERQSPTLAPYASEGEVVFRITQAVASDDEPDTTQAMLDEVKRRVGQHIYEVGMRTMPEVVRDLLINKNQTVSYAESCTGGLATGQLTDFPGASRVLKGSLVAYANGVKQELLNVPAELLEREGAVSEACAARMAEGCRRLFATDWAVAITGIAGPDGGSDDKPIGTVWLAVSGPDGTVTQQLRQGGNRARIRKVSALKAHDLLRQQLVK